MKNGLKKFSAVFFFHQFLAIKTLDPDWIRIHLKCWIRIQWIRNHNSTKNYSVRYLVSNRDVDWWWAGPEGEPAPPPPPDDAHAHAVGRARWTWGGCAPRWDGRSRRGAGSSARRAADRRSRARARAPAAHHPACREQKNNNKVERKEIKNFLIKKAGLRIQIRIGSGFNRVSGSGPGFGIRIRIQEGNNDPQK